MTVYLAGQLESLEPPYASTLGPTRAQLGPHLDPNFGPSCAQVGAKFGPQDVQNRTENQLQNH